MFCSLMIALYDVGNVTSWCFVGSWLIFIYILHPSKCTQYAPATTNLCVVQLGGTFVSISAYDVVQMIVLRRCY